MKYIVLILGTLSYIYLNFGNLQSKEPAMNAEPFAVVELFTSEGCYSCPPADRLLSEIVSESRSNNQRIYALAFHVDYWDRLGWKDAFSDKKYTNRQQDYAGAFESNTVYTPQMVVNGTQEFVGSESKTAYSKIKEALQTSPKTEIVLTTAFNRDMDMVTVNFVLKGNYKETELNFALVERGIVREIGHGENGGKTLYHDNVVRAFKTIPSEKNGTQVLNLPENLITKNSSVIVYAQNKASKKISGAQRVDLN